MSLLTKIRRMTAERVNYYCIMLEGLFNTLGADIMGMTTIVPLFLSDYGASLGLIGALPTAQGIISAVTPFITGGFIAAARSKRRLSLTVNGIARSMILLIPLSLLIGFSSSAVIAIFFGIMMVYYVCQSVTGISWNYLLGVCVQPEDRGRLMGTLFAFSGLISFLSSNIVRLLRESQRLTMAGRYASIFGLAGVLMAASVLFFIPLKEQQSDTPTETARSLRAYLAALTGCLRESPFRRLLTTQGLSTISTGINTFLYIFAQNFLHLATEQISLMIIIQTVGVVCGGFASGRISSRFGSKRTLIVVEGVALLIPLLELTALRFGHGAPLMYAAVFLVGFSRSGMMTFQSHLLEVAGKERSIYFIVTKSLVLLPLSFVSVLVGLYIEKYAIATVFIVQVVVALAALFSATRLKLFLYKPKTGEKQA